MQDDTDFVIWKELLNHHRNPHGWPETKRKVLVVENLHYLLESVYKWYFKRHNRLKDKWNFNLKVQHLSLECK